MKLARKIVPLLMVALALTPVAAQAKTSVLAGPLTNLDPMSAVIHIQLNGYPVKNGLYIQECDAPIAGARPLNCSTAQPLWISTSQGASFAPTADITFKPVAAYTSKNGPVNCLVTSCGIWISYDHTALSDTAEDQFIALTFKAGTVVAALPSDEITTTLNGATLSTRAAAELGYRAVGKIAASAKSGVALTFASSTPDCTVVNGSVTALKGAGFCNIQVISAGNASYAAYTANYPLKLTLGTQVIGVKKFPSSLKVGAARAVVAESNFGTAVNYVASSKNVCAIEGNLLLAKKKGSCVLQATAPARTDMWSALAQRVVIKIK